MTRKEWTQIADELHVLCADPCLDHVGGVMAAAWAIATLAYKNDPKLARSEFITRVVTGHA